MKPQTLWSRTTLTILAVVVLCGAGLAYSRGWFDSATTREEMISTPASTQETVEQDEAQSENAKTMSENAPLTSSDTK